MNASKSWLRNVFALGPTEQEQQVAMERTLEQVRAAANVVGDFRPY